MGLKEEIFMKISLTKPHNLTIIIYIEKNVFFYDDKRKLLDKQICTKSHHIIMAKKIKITCF